MNKKQGIIIVALLALIVCAGVLATKVNSPLDVNGNDIGLGKNTMSSSSDSKKASNSDYFTEARLTRDQTKAQTLETLKSIINEKNVSKESRDNAANKSTQIASQAMTESKIESLLKAKGYTDAICIIEDDNKANIIVKSKNKLTDKQSREIQDVVMSISKINNVEISVKQ